MEEWMSQCLTILIVLSLLFILMPTKVHNNEQESHPHSHLNQLKNSWYIRLEDRLQQAQTQLSTAQYLLLCLAAGMMLYMITGHVLDSWLLASPFLFAGILVVERWLGVIRSKRKERFEEENTKALRIMASALRTNPSYFHAFEQVAISPLLDRNVTNHYQRMLELLRAQVTLEEAMNEMYQRTGSADVQYLATIVQVQRDLGGDLSRSLDIAAATIIRRKQVNRRKKAAMSQILAQVNILSLMPFVFVGVLYIQNPQHFLPLTETLSGRVSILLCFLCIVGGGECIRYLGLRSSGKGGEE